VEPLEYCINNTQDELKLDKKLHKSDRKSFLKKKGLKGIRTVSDVESNTLNVTVVQNSKTSLFSGYGLYGQLKLIIGKVETFGKNQSLGVRGHLSRRQWAASFYKKLKELQDRCTLLQKEIKLSKSGKILEKRSQNRGIWRFLGWFKLGKGANYQKVSTEKINDTEEISDSNDEKEKKKEKKKEKVEGPEKPPKNNESDSQNCEPTIDEMLKKNKKF